MSTFFRILSLFLILTVLCSIFSVSALAVETAGYTGHNFMEYNTEGYIQDGMAYMEQTIPLVGCTVSYNTNYGDGGGWHPKYINASEYEFKSWVESELQNGDYIKWIYFPLGYFTDKNDYNLNHCISLRGLRSGTTISFKVTNSSEYLGFSPANISYLMWIQYYDINGKSVTGGDRLVPVDMGSGQFQASFDIQPPDDAVAFRPYFQVQLQITEKTDDWVAWNQLNNYQFRVVLSEADYLSNLDWYNSNKVYESVQQGNQLLDSIQQDIEDMANRPVDPELPEGAGIVDEYESAEDDLMDSVSGGMDEFENITMTAWDRIYAYSQSFLAFSFLFGLFADIPIFQSLLYISLTLGTFAFLLGLGTQAARYFDRHHTAAGKRRGG